MTTGGKLLKKLEDDFRLHLRGHYSDEEIRQFLYMLFDGYLGWDRVKVHLAEEFSLPPDVAPLFREALKELQRDKPIQYILHKAWFGNLILYVDERVLIPRPETEELCNIIRNRYSGNEDRIKSVLDVGTGSGCIALTLKEFFPEAMVTAADNSKEALEVAAINSRMCHAEITVLYKDILDVDSWSGAGLFNLIVSNPPYVTEGDREMMRSNVLNFEPRTALFVPDQDPLIYYKAIAEFASAHLELKGELWLEINERFGPDLIRLFESKGFSKVTLMKDLSGRDRFILATL